MKAMILAAGRGERMRPLTDTTPKPLLKVGGKPLIVWHIERLAAAGFREIVINIAYLGYKIPEALGDGSRWGVHITYSDEQEEGKLETLGGIVKALPLLQESDPFLVVNGDVWCDIAFDAHKRLDDETLAHLVLIPNPPHNPKGDFGLESGRVTDAPRYTFAGIGYYSPKLFAEISYGKAPLAPLLYKAIRAGKVSGELYGGTWYDIGTPQRLAALERLLNS